MTTKTTTTLCRICEAQCGLEVDVDTVNNKVLEIRPDKQHVMSQGYSCIKGLTFEDFRTSPDRLTQPLKRVNRKDESPQFVPISWQQAIKEIGEKTRSIRRQHGHDAMGLYFGNPISFSLLYPIFINGFVRGLKTSKFFNTGTLDCNNKFYVYDKMYGASFALPFPDVERNQFLMIIGGNPAISKMSFINLPHPVKKLKAITERGGRVVHLNPRKTETAKQCGEHLFIRPDTDVFFLLSFLEELLARHESGDIKLPLDKIKQHMNGFEQLRTISCNWPADKTAELTGVPADTLRELVDSYLKAEGAALYLSTGVNQGSNGTLACWVLEVINAITGNLDKLGGVQMGQGIIDYPALMAKNPAETHFSRLDNSPSFLEAFPCNLLADEILQPGAGQIHGMFVVSGNPVLSSSNSEKLARALQQLELLVSIEIVQNETANYADYILPGTHFAERPDLPFMFNSLGGTSCEPWFQYVDALVKPPGQVQDEFTTLHQLAAACDAPLFGSRIFQAMVSFGGLLKKLPLVGNKLPNTPTVLLDMISRAGKQGSIKSLRQFPHGKKREPLQENNYLGKRVVTADKKIQLAPAELIEQAKQRLDESFKRLQNNKGSLKLITKRERFSHNTWTHNHAKYVAKDRNSNYLYIHPDDASMRNIEHLSEVKVSSQAGTLQVKAKHDPDLMPGTVALPHGWGHANAKGLSIAQHNSGVNANILASDGPGSYEPLSGMTQFNGIEVSVSLVG